MSNIDNRVVSMTFDNDSFERKLGSTLASLDALTESLKFAGATQGFAEVADAADNFNLGGVEEAVQGISDKLSAMGAVGFTIIQGLTDHFLGFATSIGKVIFDPLAHGGEQRAKNIEQAKFLFEGLGMDVEDSMDSAREAVLGTAFGLDAAAKAAAQLGGSGMRAGDEMTGALRGIAGLAAMTGSSYEEMADIFISAAGTGKVMGNQLARISFRGVNAAAVLAKQWGKTEEEVRQMASEGKIGFREFAAAMDDAFGEHATEANKTYVGALANMRTALSRLGASFLGPHLEQQRNLFNALTPVIDEVAKALKPLIDTFIYLKGIATNNLIKTIQGIDLSGLKLAVPNIGSGIVNLYSAFTTVIKSLKEAFHDVFPANFSKIIVAISEAFKKLTEHVKMGAKTGALLTSVFHGLFSIFAIIFEVGKGVVSVIKTVVTTLLGASGASGAGTLVFFARLGEHLFELKKALVDGGGIAGFFEALNKKILSLGDVIQKPIDYLRSLKDTIVEFFDFDIPDMPGMKAIEGAEIPLNRVQSRFDHIRDTLGALGDKLSGLFHVLDVIWSAIANWFSELGDKLAAVMGPGDWDAVIDMINAGLIGGILVILKKFLNGGLKLDFTGGFLSKINGALDQLTGVLKNMQLKLKAEALLKIAYAIAILAASCVVLAMIDSAALTKALTAMSVGFGQLIGSMALLQKMDAGPSSVKLGVMILGFIGLATAMLILSAAMKVLATMSWGEIVKGLIGVGGGMGLLIKAVNSLSTDTGAIVRAGLSMILIATGMRILANAMQAFATMSWGEIGKGLLSVTAGLAVLVQALNAVDAKDMISAGLGIIAIAIGMRILANAMQAFATMSWTDIAKGLVAVTLGLGAIVLITNTMPAGGMIGIGIGLIAVSVALNIMAEAVGKMGGMDLGTLAKGIGAVALMMVILAAGTNAMTGAVAGAVALVIVAGALLILSKVLQVLGELSIAQLVTGLVAIAAVIIILAVAAIALSEVLPFIFGLGVALAAVGLGFALFGAGAFLVAKAFETMAKSGKAGAKAMMEAMIIVIQNIPKLLEALAESLVNSVTEFLQALPTLLKALKVVLGHVLDTIIEVAPQLAIALVALIQAGLKVLEDAAPGFFEMGFKILMQLMGGIKDHIGEITVTAIGIVVNFAKALASKAPLLIDTAINLVFSFLNAIASRAGDIAMAGLNLLVQFLSGISVNIGKVLTAVTQIITSFLTGLASSYLQIIDAGFQILIQFLLGISNNISKVIDTVTFIVLKFIYQLGQNATLVANAGTTMLVKFLSGITGNVKKVVKAITTMVTQIITALGDAAEDIVDAGVDALLSFLKGLKDNSTKTMDKFRETGIAIMKSIAKNIVLTVTEAADVLINFLNKLAAAIRLKAPEIRKAGANVASAIISGLTGGLSDKAGEVVKKIKDIAGSAVDAAKDFFGIGSPSKVFCDIGQKTMMGLANGMDDRGGLATAQAKSTANDMVNGFQKSISKLKDVGYELQDLNPVITPVLDLSKVQASAKGIGKLMDGSTIKPAVSFDKAKDLSVATNSQNGSDSEPVPAGPTQVVFEQNIYAPEALTTAELYRQTRSQITLAKEELNV